MTKPKKSLPLCVDVSKNGWLVLSDEQMSKGWPYSLLNDEQMSNWLGVEHQPDGVHLEDHQTDWIVYSIPLPVICLRHESI